MTDLSGTWRGIFNYPEGDPPTGFVAVLRESGGMLTGEVEEPHIDGPEGPPIGAVIEGRHEGAAVSFVKYYDAVDEDYDTVSYLGSVSADGSEITGRWEVSDDWSGTFIMTRETGPDAAEEEKAEAQAPVSIRYRYTTT
jgi:hypothetical protein